LPGGTGLAKAYKPVVDRTLTYLQNKGSLTGTARIAQVTTPDIRLLSDMSAIAQSDPPDGIVFNGMSVLENLRADNFQALTTPSSTADGSADLSVQVESLLVFKPHLIISTGSAEFLTKVIPALEQQWDARASGQARPFYILSPYQFNRSSLSSVVLAQSPTVQQRLIGLNAPAAANSSLYGKYVTAFHQAYSDVVRYEGYENFYDSAYYLLFAAAAAAPALTDGSSLVTGMSRLLNGEPHDVGALDLSPALQALGRGPITLNGTMGPPNFNIVTGGRDDVAAVWCVDSTKKTQTDVLRYQASDGTMQGTFPCFPDY